MAMPVISTAVTRTVLRAVGVFGRIGQLRRSSPNQSAVSMRETPKTARSA